MIVSHSPRWGTQAFDLRQGLSAVELPMKLNAAPDGRSLTSGSSFMLPRPGTANAGYYAENNTGARNLLLLSNFSGFSGATAPTSPFAGSPRTLDASSSYVALGGTGTPVLGVYSADLSTVVSINITGLGGVTAVAFSLDGSKLAVAHATSPYLRIYNTSDWSFVNAGTAMSTASPRVLAFSVDGTKLFCGSGSQKAVYNPTTGARISTSTAGGIISVADKWPTALRSPLNGNKIVCPSITAAAGYLLEYDIDTDTTTNFSSEAIPDNSYTMFADPDPAADTFYVIHASPATGVPLSVSAFTFSTRAKQAYEDPVLQTALRTSTSVGSAISSGVIHYTTPHQITGTVRDIDNNPAARVVRAYRRSDGALMAQTLSDAVTGNYVLKLYDAGPYDVQFLTETGELLNDLFYARVVPEEL